jgi:hypothetical protein
VVVHLTAHFGDQLAIVLHLDLSQSLGMLSD